MVVSLNMEQNSVLKSLQYTSQMFPSDAVRARPSLPPSLLLLEQPWETSLEGSSSLFTSAADWFCLLERGQTWSVPYTFFSPDAWWLFLYYNKWTVAKCMAFCTKKFWFEEIKVMWNKECFIPLCLYSLSQWRFDVLILLPIACTSFMERNLFISVAELRGLISSVHQMGQMLTLKAKLWLNAIYLPKHS